MDEMYEIEEPYDGEIVKDVVILIASTAIGVCAYKAMTSLLPNKGLVNRIAMAGIACAVQLCTSSTCDEVYQSIQAAKGLINLKRQKF
ncbi:MAG: hypothetical protein J6U54_12015 [Clostridiales bacterium]|nr:hypothetical protein [Clostridiales bacterium]